MKSRARIFAMLVLAALWPGPGPVLPGAGRDRYPVSLMVWMGPILIFLSTLPAPAFASTEDTVLELVRRLEAPGGYDTVYGGVRLRPPRPITSMSVEEVLAWQRSTVRQGSVSSAAGSYQIIRPTLQRLVDQGVVSPSERFDAATQDRLGRHLLHETGYRAGDISAATANRIAQVWAALPKVDGANAGRSAYEGIAGNHALIGADTFMGILDGSLRVADIGPELDRIRRGERFGFSWDRFLADIAAASGQIMKAGATIATSLLLTLFLIDLVLRAGQWIFSGDLSGTIGGLAMRLLVVCLCLAVLTYPGELIGVVDATARTLAGQMGAADGFSLAHFAAGRAALAFSLLEGLFTRPRPIQTALHLVVLALSVTMAIQTAFIIFWSLNLVFTGAAGLFAMGFGGLKETTGAAKAYLHHLVGAGLALLCALLIIATTLDLAWDIRAAGSIPVAALAILLTEIIACILIWLLPRSIAKLAKG